MRYSTAHAATSGSVPFMLRGRRSARTALAVAVASAIGFLPAVLTSSPAYASAGDITIDTPSLTVTEGGKLEFDITREGGAELQEVTLTWEVGGDSDTAVGDEDYKPTSGEITFPADTTSPYSTQTKTISIDTINDTMDEDAETLTLTITGDEAEIVFSAAIPAGLILYSSDFTAELGPRPAKFVVDSNQKIELRGPVTAVQSQRRKDKLGHLI